MVCCFVCCIRFLLWIISTHSYICLLYIQKNHGLITAYRLVIKDNLLLKINSLKLQVVSKIFASVFNWVVIQIMAESQRYHCWIKRYHCWIKRYHCWIPAVSLLNQAVSLLNPSGITAESSGITAESQRYHCWVVLSWLCCPGTLYTVSLLAVLVVAC